MAQPADGQHVRTCPLCEAMCGLRVTVEAGRVVQIRPNADDVWSRGYVCPKGTVLGEVHHDPDRLRAPMLRNDDGSFREASWPEALEATARGLQGVIARHGIGAVTAYIGNPTAHAWSLSRYVPAFIAMSGIPQTYSAGTVDQWPKNLSSLLMFGGMWTSPGETVTARSPAA